MEKGLYKAWETGTYKGEVWTMPFSFSNIVLYYNKALFKSRRP